MAILPQKKCLKCPPKLTTGHVKLSYVRRQTVPALRCRGSKCSVAKRTLCATDDQCSSVSRTQSSDAGVGDESSVVSQVAWKLAGQRPMNERNDPWTPSREHHIGCPWTINLLKPGISVPVDGPAHLYCKRSSNSWHNMLHSLNTTTNRLLQPVAKCKRHLIHCGFLLG